MNALELAKECQDGYPLAPDAIAAAAMLRPQHEAILKLRVALGTIYYATKWGVDLDSAQNDAEQALKDTEDLK